MGISFGSSNSVQMMTDVLASLSGATVSFKTEGGGVQATTTLSSTPGIVTADGTLVLFGSSAMVSADLSNSTATIDIGDILNIPAVTNGAFVDRIEVTNEIQFRGAIIGPPTA